MRKMELRRMIKSVRLQEAKLAYVIEDKSISEWTRDHEVFAIQQSLLILRQTLVDMLEEDIKIEVRKLKAA